MESDFHLAKWYFDCIAENGETIIGYSAVVRWKKFKLHYTSLMRGDLSTPFTSSTYLLSTEFPERHNETITWSCKDLDARGSWKSMFPPIERTLLQNEHGSIRWSCLMPGAEAAMRIGDAHLYGFGYVEFLEMTIPLMGDVIVAYRRLTSAPSSDASACWRPALPDSEFVNAASISACDTRFLANRSFVLL